MTLSWYLFYGMHEFGMTRQEVLRCRLGEMIDLISCLSIYNGAAVPKTRHKLTMDEILG